eukprot:1568234-Prymnesium_polylepis.1
MALLSHHGLVGDDAPRALMLRLRVRYHGSINKCPPKKIRVPRPRSPTHSASPTPFITHLNKYLKPRRSGVTGGRGA